MDPVLKITFSYIIIFRIFLHSRINADHRQFFGEIYIFQSPIISHASESEGDNYVLKMPLTLERCECLPDIFRDFHPL